MAKEDLTGQKFGRLTVISYAGYIKNKASIPIENEI